MSVLSIFLVAVAAILLAAVLLAAAAFVTPIVLVVDSAKGWMRVRWMLALEYRRPLPGTAGEARFSIFGAPVRIPARKPKTMAPTVRAPLPRRRSERRPLGRFFWRCLRNSAIRRALANQSLRLGKALLRSAVLTRWRASVSMPDPASSGMLVGGLAASGWSRKSRIQVNFQGENNLYFEIRLYPHRLVKAGLSFLACLPYRALFREWRARAPAATPT